LRVQCAMATAGHSNTSNLLCGFSAHSGGPNIGEEWPAYSSRMRRAVSPPPDPGGSPLHDLSQTTEGPRIIADQNSGDSDPKVERDEQQDNTGSEVKAHEGNTENGCRERYHSPHVPTIRALVRIRPCGLSTPPG